MDAQRMDNKQFAGGSILRCLYFLSHTDFEKDRLLSDQPRGLNDTVHGTEVRK
jgi:hypothetical protein